jgi:hypothetical protein
MTPQPAREEPPPPSGVCTLGLDDVVAMFRHLAGREPTAEELAEVQVSLDAGRVGEAEQAAGVKKGRRKGK